ACATPRSRRCSPWGPTSTLLSDTDSDVRIFAVNVLFSLRHPRVPQLAWDVIRTDPHVNVCAAAVDVLAELGTSEMHGDLEALVQRFPDEPFLRFAVSAAMKQIS
ncbi:HEAT repeat domain-containing protein, partial [Rhodoplanes sp. SY1]|uniref:HEAT repeat domain-containing protein n=1 Tax=Rhodoplanes sp. SY1 TaxID=3166646 RepID=UPI0038B45084